LTLDSCVGLSADNGNDGIIVFIYYTEKKANEMIEGSKFKTA
jgi:hypothetical protein